MYYSALFLLVALALGDAATTAISDVLQTVPFSDTSIVSRRLDGTTVAAKNVVADVLKDKQLLEIFGQNPKEGEKLSTAIPGALNHLQHMNDYEKLHELLKHYLENIDIVTTDQAIISSLVEHYGMPAVSRYVDKISFTFPEFVGATNFKNAMLDSFEQEKLSLSSAVEKMSLKDAKVNIKTLQDFPRALLTQYVQRQGVTSVQAAELVTSAVLLEHFGAKLDTIDKIKSIYSGIHDIKKKPINTIAKELDFDIMDFNEMPKGPKARAFLLFVGLQREGANSLGWVGNVGQIIDDTRATFTPFGRYMWQNIESNGIEPTIQQFVDKVFPNTIGGKIRYFLRRMWFRLSAIFRKQSDDSVVANKLKLENPQGEILEIINRQPIIRTKTDTEYLRGVEDLNKEMSVKETLGKAEASGQAHKVAMPFRGYVSSPNLDVKTAVDDNLKFLMEMGWRY